MQDGEVYVWWPCSDPISTAVNNQFETWDKEHKNRAVASENSIPCATWDLSVELFRLPGLPPLLPLLDSDDEEADREITIVKLACFDCHLVALTNKGHVLKYNTLEDPITAQTGAWAYV